MKKYFATVAIGVFVIGIIGMMVGTKEAAALTGGAASVTGSVSNTCKVDTPLSGVLDFGAIDPSTNTAAASPKTGSLKLKCTNKYTGYLVTAATGSTPTAADCTGAGVAGSITTGTSAIPYTVTCSHPTGIGFGSTIDVAPVVTIGSIPQDAEAGSYTDTVTITIAP